MAFRKLVGSYKDYNLSTHIIEHGYLAVDVDTGSLRLGDGVTPGGTEVSAGGGGSSLGDLTATGSTLQSPSNADLTLTSSGGNVVIEEPSVPFHTNKNFVSGSLADGFESPVTTSLVILITDFEFHFLIELRSFCIVSGIIYPLNLMLKLPFTNLSLPAVNSVVDVNESINALN